MHGEGQSTVYISCFLLTIGMQGAVPFMSAEVMNIRHRLAHNKYNHRAAKFTRQAVHDMESFFWVLVYICLTRNGPDGTRRNELDHEDNPSDDTEGLQDVINCLFGCDWANIARNKTRVLECEKDLVDLIFPYFHPYFNGLKDLMRKWRELLYRAHQFHLVEYDTIHDRSLELIEEALVKIASNLGEDREPTKKDCERRNVLEPPQISGACRNALTNPPSQDLSRSVGEVDVPLDIRRPTSPERPVKKPRLE